MLVCNASVARRNNSCTLTIHTRTRIYPVMTLPATRWLHVLETVLRRVNSPQRQNSIMAPASGYSHCILLSLSPCLLFFLCLFALICSLNLCDCIWPRCVPVLVINTNKLMLVFVQLFNLPCQIPVVLSMFLPHVGQAKDPSPLNI